MHKGMTLAVTLVAAGALTAGVLFYTNSRNRSEDPEEIVKGLLGDKVEIATKQLDEEIKITAKQTPAPMPAGNQQNPVGENPVTIEVADENLQAILSAAEKAALMKSYSYERAGDYKNTYLKCSRSGSNFYFEEFRGSGSTWGSNEKVSVNLSTGSSRRTSYIGGKLTISDDNYTDIEKRWTEFDVYGWLVTEMYEIVKGYAEKGKDQNISILKGSYGEDIIRVSSVTSREESVEIRNMEDFTMTDLSYFIPQNFNCDTFVIEVECSDYSSGKLSNHYDHDGKQAFYLDKKTGMLVHWRYYKGESLSAYTYFYQVSGS